MSISDWFAIGFAAGYAVAWLTYRQPPAQPKITANLVIDQEVLDKIEAEKVVAWLNQRGLTWMPKGAVFVPGKEIKK